MKKLLYLLFITSSIFSMQLDIVRGKKQSAIRRAIKIKSASNSTSKQICSTFRSKDNERIVKNSGNITKEVSKSKSTQYYPIGEKNLSIPQGLGNIFLYHYNREFYIVRNSNVFPLKHCFMDEELRGISKEKLESLIAEDVYLSINPVGDNDYSLKLNGRLNGGGPIFGVAMYWLTKTICYGTVLAATAVGMRRAGKAVVKSVATKGTKAATVGKLASGTVSGIVQLGVALTTASTGGLIGTTAGVVGSTAATGASIATGAGIVAGAITEAGLAGEAVIATSGFVSSASNIGGAVSVIESLAMTIGTFFGMLPTP